MCVCVFFFTKKKYSIRGVAALRAELISHIHLFDVMTWILLSMPFETIVVVVAINIPARLLSFSFSIHNYLFFSIITVHTSTMLSKEFLPHHYYRRFRTTHVNTHKHCVLIITIIVFTISPGFLSFYFSFF